MKLRLASLLTDVENINIVLKLIRVGETRRIKATSHVKCYIWFSSTEYGGHAKELVQSIDLERWSGIVIVSGDGLVYEVKVNFVFLRQFFNILLVD